MNSRMHRYFQHIVDCLLYLSNMTRPDIAHAVLQISRFMARSEEMHLKAQKPVFRYLVGTIKHQTCAVFQRSRRGGAAVLCRRELRWRRRVSAPYYRVCGGDHGGCCSLGKSHPENIPLSSDGADCVAMCRATQSVVFLLHLLLTLNVEQHIPIFLFKII